MRKNISTLAATIAATATMAAVPVVLTSAPAEAANSTPGCITRTEFRKVAINTTLPRARQIIGARGRVTSNAEYSDGDVWRDIDFRQCGRTWANSSVSVSFESTETEEWVPDYYCDDSGCEDWGGYETVYSYPLRVTHKYAYWG